jgi:hypothetical protein
MAESQQPQLLISVTSGYLVFIGLVVAGSSTVLASDAASALPVWARFSLWVPLLLSALSGICALVAANAAHNLGRGQEKLAARRLSPQRKAELTDEIETDRRLAADCLWWALTGAVASAVVLFSAMLLMVFMKREQAPTRPPPETGATVVAQPAFELLGEVTGFPLAKERPNGDGAARSIAAIRRKWCSARVSGREGVLLVIGSTDRIPLGPSLSRRFDSNVGLAQARATAVSDLLFPEGRPKAIIALAAGPSRTPDDFDPRTSAGYKSDRKVNVWALWQPTGGARSQSIEECRQESSSVPDFL